MSSTVAERLLAARTKKQAAYEETLEVPGFDGQLFCRYRPLDFREARTIGQRHERLHNEIEKELRVAADSLARASVACEARIEGETHELPKLGLKLCEAIGLDGPENDIQAVLAIFPTEMAVMQQFVAVQTAEESANGHIDDELVGKSQAVS